MRPLAPRLVAHVDGLRAERFREVSSRGVQVKPATRAERQFRRLAYLVYLGMLVLLAAFAFAAFAGDEAVAQWVAIACLPCGGAGLWLMHVLNARALRRGVGLGVVRTAG